MKQFPVLLSAGCLLLACSLAAAQVVVNPRIKINKSLDLSSAEEVVAQIVTPDMDDEAKAIACWRFMLDHFYHWFPPHEESSSEPVRDFAKAINSYGFSPCFGNAPVLTDLWEAAGLKTRSWTITGHAIPEVWYNDAWHMLDADARAFHRKADGQIASVEELAKDRELATNPPGGKSDPFYPFGAPDVAVAPLIPWGGPSKMVDLYASRRDNYRYNKRAVFGHRMFLELRPGETLTLSPENVGKWFKFSHLPKDMVWRNAKTVGGEKIETKLDTGPVNVDGKYTYGNGTLVFHPDLARIKADELLWAGSENVKLADGKLAPADASKPAVAVIRTYCPWVLVEAKAEIKSENADAGALKLEISTDGGHAWFDLAGDRSETGVTVDLTEHVAGKYEYLLRATLGTAVTDLKLDNLFQVSQLALPRMVPGRNFITVYRGPDQGVVYMVQHGGKACKDRYVVESEGLNIGKALNPVSKDKPGYVIFKLAAPAPLVGLSVGGNISISRGPIPFVQADWSIDGGKTWTKAFRLEKNANPDNTQFEEDAAIRLPESNTSREALLRFTIAGDSQHGPGKQYGGVESVRFYGYYRRPQPAGASMKLTLAWSELTGQQWIDKQLEQKIDQFPTELMPNLGGEQVKLKKIVFENPR